MPGNTPELNLKTAVDADDNADYLTISLASSLQTVDALFSNTTGHSHSGAHQGGPITSIPAGAIVDGSITSAKIADGTITGTDIADSTITTAKLAANAVTQLQRVSGGADFLTTSTSFVDVTGMSITMTTVGGPLVVWYSGPLNSVAGSTAVVSLGLDGSDQGTLMAYNFTTELPTAFVWFGTASVGSHTVKLRLRSSAGGSVSIRSSGAMASALVVAELKR